ncbi:hypothetical protein BH09PSE2_BH09PSE2_11960 [soil metagenome]
MSTVTQQHQSEVERGERFQFGKNWAQFLKTLTDQKIELAMESLREYLQVQTLEGKSFIDIGSGSGLFSLAARRLGATVHSFDYDPDSFGCTQELRRRYFPNDADWKVEQASVLDTAFMGSLPQYDVVYSWGVLHHTGAMWDALANVKPLVPKGGKLFIAIYNDRGAVTDEWARIKKVYNQLPAPLDYLYALKVIAREEGARFRNYAGKGQIPLWISHWTRYDTMSLRGMSQWHDWIDWIGGWPYERATVEQIVDFYAADGFRLTKLQDSSAGFGCSQFVFDREEGAGVLIDQPLPGGDLLSRRFGRRVVEPFQQEADGRWTGRLPVPPVKPPGAQYMLMRGDRLLGPVALNGDRVEIGAAGDTLEALRAAPLHVMAGQAVELPKPYENVKGMQYRVYQEGLASLADTPEDPRGSKLAVFENDQQLPMPHMGHDEIAGLGGGRFSHWSQTIEFSALDGSNPNTNGRRYIALVAIGPLPADRSLALQFGVPLQGEPTLGPQGWTLPGVEIQPTSQPVHLVRDDSLAGELRRDDAGRVIVAAPGEPAQGVRQSVFHLVSGERIPLASGWESVGGKGYSQLWSRTDYEADDSNDPRRSTLFLFEGDRQLPYPHSPHGPISDTGAGAFAHWGDTIYMSTLHGANPNDPTTAIGLFIPEKLARA